MDLSQIAMIAVYVAYAGTWLLIAVALWMHSERTAKLGIAGKLRLLALFAFVHALADLTDVALRLPGLQVPPTSPIAAVRLTLLTASFVILAQFGLALNIEDKRVYRSVLALGTLMIIGLGSGLVALYAKGATTASIATVERASRLLVGLPGAVLASIGFLRLSRKCDTIGMRECANDARLAAVSIGAYGILAGAITTGYPTVNVIFGLPIQFFRMVAAVGIAVATINMMRRFRVKPPEERRLSADRRSD